MTMRLNDKKIPPGGYLWFDSTFQMHGAVAAAFEMQKSQVKVGGHTYAGPTGVVTVTPSVKTATVTSSNASIVSTIPSTISSKTFMNGVIVYLPAGLPAHQSVTWTARFLSSQPFSKGLKIQWQSSASAYSRFSTSYRSLQIKPVAGTPESFVKDVIPGVGTTASSQTVTICPC
ncbi:MAG TPA: hypothetical protein VFE36_09555 [Candidatus Baltobacteraceae bacterium]|nr:hypothetical protein [Candidatus Baltobacteraceae bacterium]